MEEMTFTAGDHLASGIGAQPSHLCTERCERNTVHSALDNYHSELFKEICGIFTENCVLPKTSVLLRLRHALLDEI